MLMRQYRISKSKRAALLKEFVYESTAFHAGQKLRINKKTANRYFNHFRECILECTRRPPRLFGEVEVDQAFFGGRGKKKTDAEKKRKIHKKIPKTQVLGMLQRGGNVYVQIIEKADKKTLMPIMHLVLEPTTIVYTDRWRAYADLKIEKYEHREVDHSQAFFNRVGLNIGGIEAFWSFCKRRLAKFNGMSKRTFPLHIKECEMRYNVKNNDEFLKLMRKLAF